MVRIGFIGPHILIGLVNSVYGCPSLTLLDQFPRAGGCGSGKFRKDLTCSQRTGDYKVTTMIGWKTFSGEDVRTYSCHN